MEHQNGSAEGTRWERPDAPLGTLVYRAGLLSKDKLESALEEGRRSGRRLGEILLQKGWIEEKDLARLLAGQKGLPFVSLRGRGFDEELARSLPERVCRFHNAMAVEVEGADVLVAIADPGNDEALADIRRELGRPFQLVVATPTEIRTALDDTFGSGRPQAPVPPPAVPLAPAPSNGSGDLAAGLRLAAAAPAVAEAVLDEPAALRVAAEPVEATSVVAFKLPEDEPRLAPAAIGADTSEVHPSEPFTAADEPRTSADVHGLREPVPAPSPSRSDAPELRAPGEPLAAPSPFGAAEVPRVEAPAPEPPAVAAPPERDALAEPEAPAMPQIPIQQLAPEPPAVAAPPEREAPVEPEAPATPEIRIEQLTPETPREEPVPLPPRGWEPRIEPDEDAHVSVAFHAPASPEPEPDSEPEPAAAPMPVGGLEPAPSREPQADGGQPWRELPEEEPRFRLVLELDGENDVELGVFGDGEAAREAARDFIAHLARRDEWPLIGSRFVRPERIRSLEVRERPRFAGPSGRHLWGAADDG